MKFDITFVLYYIIELQMLGIVTIHMLAEAIKVIELRDIHLITGLKFIK